MVLYATEETYKFILRKGFNMNIKNELENQKATIDLLIKDTKKKYDRKELISILGSVFCGTVGLFTLISMPLYGVSLLATALGLFLKKKSLDSREKRELLKYEKEKRHIDKISKEGIDVRSETTKKRINKINGLLAENKKKNKTYKDTKLSDNLALFGLGFSVLVTTLIPIVGIIGSGLFTIAKIYTGEKLEKAHEELELNRLRANNIITDINTIKMVQNNTRKKKQTKPVQKQTSRTASKERKISQEPQRRKIDEKNHQAVEEYIRKLSQQSENLKGNQKVKKY